MGIEWLGRSGSSVPNALLMRWPQRDSRLHLARPSITCTSPLGRADNELPPRAVTFSGRDGWHLAIAAKESRCRLLHQVLQSRENPSTKDTVVCQRCSCLQARAAREAPQILKGTASMAEGILQDLHQDHEAVRDLIEQLLKTESAAERTPLFKELMSMLLAHSHAEQNVLYKKMEKSGSEEARSFAYEGTNEHQIVEQQLQQMSRVRNKASEQWTAQLTVLRELVNHHVKEEESTGFSCARSEFDSEQLEKFGERFRRQKEKLMVEM